MRKLLRIGTRESQLAVWQATQVKNLLAHRGIKSKLVYIKSEGDLDLKTPLYEMGVQGIFTRSLDTALLNDRIDIAVHSMKDVPTQMAQGIAQAAVLKRGNPKDLLVCKGERENISVRLSILKDQSTQPDDSGSPALTIATSSIRRRAQWLNRYPGHHLENLRGNINTRLQKLAQSNWDGAIFAAAGLERMELRSTNTVELEWMLPAPAQGAIVVVCKEGDNNMLGHCHHLHDEQTALCTKIERDFLRTLLGGCSTPIAALAEIEEGDLYFRGNILTPDGQQKAEIEKILPVDKSMNIGNTAAEEILNNGGEEIIARIRHAKN